MEELSGCWQGTSTGHAHEPTIILEVVVSFDLWIWHAFFELPGSPNNINVLDMSSLFITLAQVQAPQVNYTINGNDYTMGYYLVDGIYPQWATFAIPCPQGNKKKLFAQAQEASRKDVECAFGMLQARFATERGPARFGDRGTLKNIMTACIILHNMITEDGQYENGIANLNYDTSDDGPHAEVSHERITELMKFIKLHHRIKDRETHSQFQSDLVEHLWKIYSQS